MSRIIRLDDELINRIASGEIIEKPANAVKELVENSLDSGASKITVELKDGGSKVIQITDNGCGMADEDLLLAFERHATSKISSVSDLYNIRTMGFRGEALPSIASVSKVEVYTRETNSSFGNYLRIEGGQLRKIQQVSCSEGTVITVKDLFYNTPVRRKFMKSAAVENSNVVEIMLRYILTRPDVLFTLINNNRVILKTSGNGNLKDCALLAMGSEIQGNMIEISYAHENYPLIIRGLISKPGLSYPRSGNIYFSINHRYVRSNVLLNALTEGYRGYLMVNKFPAAVLDFDLNPDRYDINIHPAKTEVKFISEPAVFNGLLQAISDALTKSHSFMPAKTEPPVNQIQAEETAKPSEQKLIFDSTDNVRPSLQTVSSTEEVKPDINVERFDFSQARIIGQFKKSYVLAEWNDCLIVVDQHAAHEKILFETLSEIYMAGRSSQPLLVPVVKELSAPLKNNLLERKDAFARAGIVLEDFGALSIRIREIPAFVNQKEIDQLFETIRELHSDDYEFLRQEIIRSVACHRAVKNGDTLRPDEMLSLLKGLEKLKNPFNCPHGRPVILKFSLETLDRFFRRT